jgi:predicted HAD superfamily Cof-like phosphohydrolase
MMVSTKAVKEFSETFEFPVGESPTCVESLESRQLRVKLIFEELSELAEASDVKATLINLCLAASEGVEHPISDGDNVNKLEELDALADLEYVLQGKIVSAGFHYVFADAFKQVHENNMNKAHRTVDHADKTMNKVGGTFEIVLNGGAVLLYNKDGKLIKPHDHVKVSLEKYIK